jgi:hypothetical protein
MDGGSAAGVRSERRADTIAVAEGVLAGPRKGTDYREGTPVFAAVGAERSGYN